MTEEMILRNGSVLISVTGYSGDDDFYAMYDLTKEMMNPETMSVGVDSMCIDGSFRKDGLLVRLASDCVNDTCCFHFDATSMTEAEQNKVRGWIEGIVKELNNRRLK